MESELTRAEFTVESDTWNTLWLIKKALNEGRKRKVPVKIEVESGSVAGTISLLADIFTIGSFLFAMAAYIQLKRHQNKPLRTTSFTGDAAFAYVTHHLRTEADVSGAKLISEKTTSGDGYFLKLEDLKQKPSIHYYKRFHWQILSFG